MKSGSKVGKSAPPDKLVYAIRKYVEQIDFNYFKFKIKK